MKELIERITTSVAAFKNESEKEMCGNKSAGVRARRISLDIERMLKEYRKQTIEATKK